MTLENLGWLRRHWTSNEDNLVLDDADLAIRELAAFVAAGGRTIVDATVPGIGRDPDALVRIARGAGINIVMGAGAYIASTHPAAVTRLDEDGLVEQLLDEWRQGVGDTGIRPGFLGEIGCSWPLDDRERKVLRAAGRVQAATGAALMVHPGRDARAPGRSCGSSRRSRPISAGSPSRTSIAPSRMSPVCSSSPEPGSTSSSTASVSRARSTRSIRAWRR